MMDVTTSAWAGAVGPIVSAVVGAVAGAAAAIAICTSSKSQYKSSMALRFGRAARTVEANWKTTFNRIGVVPARAFAPSLHSSYA